MKKILMLFSFCSCFFCQGQGLENIVVEKYYISTAADTVVKKGGRLPVGSVTYRIYVDLMPGFRFQAAYGSPGHELRIATTTSFFNNEDQGAATANDIPTSELQNNTVMLDSWLSVGAGSERNYAILKAEDTTRAIVNADGILQNIDPAAGIPLTVKDGLMPYHPLSVVTPYKIDSLMKYYFGNKNYKTKDAVFSTNDGAWASFGGAVGPTKDNKVLIAQITTDGVLSFELNVQIGDSYGGYAKYVAQNPVGDEILFPNLIYPPKELKAAEIKK